MKLKQFQKGLDLYFESVKIYEEHQEKRYIGMAYSNISMIYCEMNEFDKALEYANKSLELKQIFGNPIEIANTLSNIGNIYNTQKNYDKALDYFNQSLIIYENGSDKISLAGIYIKLGYLFCNKDNQELAESYLLKGLEIAKSVHSQNIIKESCRLLSKIYYEQQQYQKAYNHLEEYMNAYVSIFEDNPKITVAKSEADYYRKKTENQAEIYRQSNIDLTEKNSIITEQSKQINETNTVLRDLLSVMAHDVRGPVTSASQALSMILEKNFTEQESDDLLKEIILSLQNTTQLLNELMEWVNKAKLKGKVIMEPVDVCSVITDSISLHQNLAVLKKVKISFSAPEAVYANTVKNYLLLVIRNLLHNALKFTPSEGTIEVSISTNDKKVLIAIKDSGIGMTQDEVTAIMDGRAQIKTGTNKEAGSGFGLDLCQNYLAQMQGKLSLQSTLNQGSVFTITLNKA
jgi:signal transduction histidine kinase